jgi:FeS assembly SUF system protein
MSSSEAFDFEASDAPATLRGNPELEAKVLDALRGVFDPEIPVNIVELGLIYELKVDEAGAVEIDMTLTAPNCPVAGEMPAQVEQAARAVEGVTAAKANLVWTPPWDPSRMTEEAKLELGMF